MDINFEKFKQNILRQLKTKYINCRIDESISKWVTNNRSIYYFTFDILTSNGESRNIWYEIVFNKDNQLISIKTNNISGDSNNE